MSKKQKLDTQSPDYRRMLDLIEIVNTSTTDLNKLQAAADEDLANYNSERKDEYADLQTAITDATKSLEIICLEHPEWFKEKQTIKTPFGAMGFRETESLQIPCEEITLALLLNAARQEPMSGIELAVKTVNTINREVLEKLTDEELAKYRVTRLKKKSFNVKPAKVEMGKAVSAAEEAESKTGELVA